MDDYNLIQRILSMSTLQKMILNYVSVFGGGITFLTVMGYWNEVNEYLDTNSHIGLIATGVHLFGSYIHYDSKAKVKKMRIDKATVTASSENMLGNEL